MDNNNSALMWLWMTLATLGGAITSISLRPYKEMTRPEIILAFFVSSTFAMFVGSVAAEVVARWAAKYLGGAPVNLRVYGAVMWFMAASAHFLLPVAIGRAKRFISAFGTQPGETK